MHISELIAVAVFITVVLTVYVLELYLIVISIRAKLGSKKIPPRVYSKHAIVLHIVAAFGLACLVYGFFIEPYWVQVGTIEIETEKLKSTTFRVLQFSDIHSEARSFNEQKLTEIAEHLKPDIIVFTGDCLNSRRGLPRFKETLSRLNAPLGKFAVFGNIDTWWWSDIDLFADTGFELLHEKTVSIEKNGESLRLTGFACTKAENYRTVLNHVPDDHFSILLYHYSDLIESLTSLNVDLYLAGHTHGGQIRLPFYGSLITLAKFGKKYEAGLYTVGQTNLYVNRGIGFEGGVAPRAKFLCRPEVSIFEIKPKQPKGERTP